MEWSGVDGSAKTEISEYQSIDAVNGSGTAVCWAGPLANGDSGVILFNRDDFDAQIITAQFDDVGITSASAVGRDIWNHTSFGSFTNSYTATVQSHGGAFPPCLLLPPCLPASLQLRPNSHNSPYHLVGLDSLICLTVQFLRFTPQWP